MTSDSFATRVVVVALAIVVVGGLAAVTYLASTQTPIPDALDRLVFTALGSIGTLLVKTTVDNQRMTIDQPVDDPIPVEEVAP